MKPAGTRIFGRSMILVALALASAQAFAAEPLIRKGQGNVNGIAFPVRVLSSFGDGPDLEKWLTKRYGGKRTIFRENGGSGPLYLVLDLASQQCPVCTHPKDLRGGKASEKTLDRIFSEAEAFQVFDLVGGERFAIWSPAGKLLGLKPFARYRDPRFSALEGDMHDVLHGTFVFANTSVSFFDGTHEAAPKKVFSALDQAFRSQGYRSVHQVPGEGQEDLGPRPGLRYAYRKRDAFLSMAVSPLPDGTGTQVSITETQSPKEGE